jgi:hypothetical protein
MKYKPSAFRQRNINSRIEPSKRCFKNARLWDNLKRPKNDHFWYASDVDTMEAKEISQIIEAELNGDWSLSNAHGVDLKRCLVNPSLQTYDNWNQSETLRLWLVLEEMPDDKSGYKIVFDEKSKMFGLATTGFGQRDTFLGFYGTFLETLEGM